MKIIYIVSLILLSAAAHAQLDTGPMGGISVPRKNANTTVAPSTTTISPDSPFNLKPETKPNNYPKFSVGEKKPEFSMVQEPQFANRTQEFEKRTNVMPKGESNEAYRGNMDFGQIHTKSPYIVLHARDFGAEDGDRIKVTVNDRIIISEATLSYNSKPIIINLSDGFNDIRVEALNQGTLGPNTGAFYLYDKDQKGLSGGEWNLATGFYARFLVIKDP